MAHLQIESLGLSFGGVRALGPCELRCGRKGDLFDHRAQWCRLKPPYSTAISGIYKPDSGSIRFEGRDLTGLKPHRVAAAGIARTFQNIELFSHMTTMDNLMLGRHLHMKNRGLVRSDSSVARRSRGQGRDKTSPPGGGDRRFPGPPVRPEQPGGQPSVRHAEKGSNWPGPWPWNLACCCWMNRPRA